MQRYFCVIPPAVHLMLLTLGKAGLTSRMPSAIHAVALQVGRDYLPALQHRYD